MNKILSIAINTFKEAVRNRVLYVLLFFSVLIMFGAWVASTLSIDDESKIVRDLGIGAINVISLLIAVFVGIGLVYNDLDKKTIYTIVSKPITRWQFLLGKYLGLMLTIAVNVIFMTWIFASVLHFRSFVSPEIMNRAVFVMTDEGSFAYRGTVYHLFYYIISLFQALFLGLFHILSLGFDGSLITKGLFTASVLTILEMSIITAFAVLFSSFSSPTLSAFLTVIVFIIGRLNQDLYLFADTMVRRAGGLDALSTGQVVAYWFSVASSYICPNLAIFDRRRELSEFESVWIGPLDFAYAIVYTTLIIFIAIVVFNRRNFK
ncbi:MAG: ABC transporter permease [Candidatus Sumerlaeia bacterium]|nr:ABC transporter permease [Candidatus Sumerlaeia bacterium]